ncbi:MAG: hypothetical protein PHE84_03785 [bacterium]|nr:hypothetical protein [bacterium]
MSGLINYPNRRTAADLFLPAFLLAGFLGSCGGGTGTSGGGDVKTAFGPFSETTVYTSQVTKPDGTQEVFTGQTAGQKVINGVSYARHQFGPSNATTPKRGLEVWVNLKDEKLAFAGGQTYYSTASNASQPYLAVTLDQPLEIDTLPPVGVPQTFHVQGDFSLQETGIPDPYPVDEDVTYTLEDDAATVDTGMGKIYNCRRYTGSATVGGTLFEAELYYKPEIGPVSGKVNWPPPNGFSADLLSVADNGASEDGYNTIQATKVIGPANPSFQLSTYDVNQDFDADKDSHAKMLLEFRWADEQKAKETSQPYVNPEFGTVWGIYPYELVSSPVSIFFPEENGKGFTYWMAYVDQAAKNESQNGIAYHISLNLESFITSEMRVTGRIHYKLYQP